MKKNKLPNYLLDIFFKNLTYIWYYYYAKFILTRILKLEENSKKKNHIYLEKEINELIIF